MASTNYFKIKNGVNVQPLATSVAVQGDLAYNSSSNQLEVYTTTTESITTTSNTQTLTNKTLTSPVMSTITTNSQTLSLPAITGSDTVAVLGLAQTLTNKTIAAGSNTISGITNSNLSGSAGITVANGGTGASTLTANELLLGNGTSAISSLTNGSQYQSLVANSSGSPSFQAISLAQSAAVTGQLGISNGGTGQATQQAALNALAPSSATNGQVISYNGTNWVASTPAAGTKNYLTAITTTYGTNTGNGNFEFGSTTGWAKGTIGTLTNGLPTGTPNFSGSTSNLTISATSSSPLAGGYSLSYALSAASTQGNMVATSAFYIDQEDQGKVLTVKFYYSATSNASNCNFSGTSSNSFGWAAYDVTNSVWLSSTGNFNLVQSSGVGTCTGTFQTGSSTQQVAFCFYNVNATSGAATLYIDDVFVGPQTAPMGPCVSDWGNTPWTPTGSWTSNSTYTGKWRRVGDTMECQVNIALSGAPTSTSLTVNLPSGYSIDTTKIPNGAASITPLGSAETLRSGVSTFVGHVDYSSTTAVAVNAFNASGTYAILNNVSATVPATFASGDEVFIFFRVPIVGWSSNTSMSSDTDTRVVALKAHTTTAANMGTLGTGATVVKYDTVDNDTHGAYSPSTGIYTAPVTGYYNFAASILTSGTMALNTQVYLLLYNVTSSTTLASAAYTSGGAVTDSTPTALHVDSIYLTAGTQVEIQANFSGTYTSGAYATSGVYNYLSISRQSGPAVIAATESVRASYQSTATTALTNSAATLSSSWSKITDSHNAFASGVYTVPVSGTYFASAAYGTGSTTTVQTAIINLLQAGSASTKFQGSYSNPTTNNNNLYPEVSGLFYCLAGDTITIQILSNTATPAVSLGGTAASQYFNIYRVGN